MACSLLHAKRNMSNWLQRYKKNPTFANFLRNFSFFCAILLLLSKNCCIFAQNIYSNSMAKDNSMNLKTSELLRSSVSWDGVALPDYPSGRPELVVSRLVFPVGAMTGWHHHNVINYGIVEQGDLTIVCEDGNERTFHEGEAIVEVVDTIHRGENRGNKQVILNMFYVSEPGQTITVQHPEFH